MQYAGAPRALRSFTISCNLRVQRYRLAILLLEVCMELRDCYAVGDGRVHDLNFLRPINDRR